MKNGSHTLNYLNFMPWLKQTVRIVKTKASGYLHIPLTHHFPHLLIKFHLA